MTNEIEEYLKSAFAKIIERPPHSLILANPNQTSINTALEWLAAQLIERQSDITGIEPDGADIKIGQIRPLYRLAHHRRGKASRRVIVINQAGLMSLPAQNALLKLLEEPPAGVIFLLGTTDQARLVPTIRSRSRLVELPKVLRADFARLFPGDSPKQIERRYQLSQGDPLLADNLDELAATIEEVKRFLSLPVAELAAELSKLNPSREQVAAWCQGLVLICQAAFRTAKTKVELQDWLDRSEALLQAQSYLRANASHKLAFKWLLLEMRQ